MAQKTTVVMIDDVDNTPIEEGQGETVTFGLDGTTYEVDLKQENAAALRDSFSKWIDSARRVSGGRGRPRSAPAPSRTKTEADPTAVRAWAKANDIQVSDRGRISAKVLEQYRAAGN